MPVGLTATLPALLLGERAVRSGRASNRRCVVRSTPSRCLGRCFGAPVAVFLETLLRVSWPCPCRTWSGASHVSPASQDRARGRASGRISGVMADNRDRTARQEQQYHHPAAAARPRRRAFPARSRDIGRRYRCQRFRIAGRVPIRETCFPQSAPTMPAALAISPRPAREGRRAEPTRCRSQPLPPSSSPPACSARTRRGEHPATRRSPRPGRGVRPVASRSGPARPHSTGATADARTLPTSVLQLIRARATSSATGCRRRSLVGAISFSDAAVPREGAAPAPRVDGRGSRMLAARTSWGSEASAVVSQGGWWWRRRISSWGGVADRRGRGQAPNACLPSPKQGDVCAELQKRRLHRIRRVDLGAGDAVREGEGALLVALIQGREALRYSVAAGTASND